MEKFEGLRDYLESLSDLFEYMDYDMMEYIGPEIFSSIASFAVPIIVGLLVGISSVVCCIIAICQFAQKNSYKLSSVALTLASIVVSSYAILSLIQVDIVDGLAINNTIAICIILIFVIAIGGGIALYLTQREENEPLNKQWMANIIFATISAAILFLLTKVKLGFVINYLSTFIFQTKLLDSVEGLGMHLLLSCVAGLVYRFIFFSFFITYNSSNEFCTTNIFI